ncbi:MAG: DUF3891 family protein [Betaproteobacteria bacterium]|nr:DUF3891 family protein [Betaproteobacteria bacterium]
MPGGRYCRRATIMMVNRYDESRLLLVLQIDHSRIAGLLAAHWGNREFARPEPYVSMVLAAQEHDGGWWDWEIRPTLDGHGRPHDYIGGMRTLGEDTWLDFMRHGVRRVAERDPYAGCIVSMHSEGLLSRGLGLLPNMPDYTIHPNVQEFIREQKAYRAKLMEAMRSRPECQFDISEDRLWTNFKYMEAFDQLAQFLCNRYPFNSKERKNGPTHELSGTPVPVAAGCGDAIMRVDVRDESNAVVRPYPFDVDSLVVSFPGRLVADRAYASQEDFLPDFYAAERVTVTYRLHRA